MISGRGVTFRNLPSFRLDGSLPFTSVSHSLHLSLSLPLSVSFSLSLSPLCCSRAQGPRGQWPVPTTLLDQRFRASQWGETGGNYRAKSYRSDCPGACVLQCFLFVVPVPHPPTFVAMSCPHAYKEFWCCCIHLAMQSGSPRFAWHCGVKLLLGMTLPFAVS